MHDVLTQYQNDKSILEFPVHQDFSDFNIALPLSTNSSTVRELTLNSTHISSSSNPRKRTWKISDNHAKRTRIIQDNISSNGLSSIQEQESPSFSENDNSIQEERQSFRENDNSIQDQRSPSTILEFGKDHIIHEPTGGQIINSKEALIQHNEFISKLGWVPTTDANNPLYPWKNDGEIWLTNLLFRSGNVSRKVADELLNAFADGRISMANGPLQFTNSREMIKLLDIAAENGVVRN